MSASDLTVFGSLAQALGEPYSGATGAVWLEFNTENKRVIDDEGVERIGAGEASVASDGTLTVSGIPRYGNTNPTSFQCKIHYDLRAVLPARRGFAREVGDFGWMTIPRTQANITNKALTSNVATLTYDAETGLEVGHTITVANVDTTFNGTYTITAISEDTSTDTYTVSYAKTASNVSSTAATGLLTSRYVALRLLEDEQAIPPNYQTAFTDSMEAIRDEAEAARDAAVDISNISIDDDIVEALVKNTGGAGPKTSAALTASTRGTVSTDASDFSSDIGEALAAQYDLKNAESLALHSPVGTGLSDTVSAFAAAIAAAPSGGVVVVPKPATEYLWDSTLTITKPITLVAPQGATIRLGSNERLSIQSNDVKFEGFTFVKKVAEPWLNLLRPRTTPVVQATGVEFRRCKFDGIALRFWAIGTLNPDGTTQASGTGTDIKTAKLLDCEFTNYAESYTVYFAGTTDCLVERCWFHDYGLDSNKGEGVKVQGGAVGTRILNSVFENSTRDAIDVYDSSYNTIIGNTFRNMAAVGVDMKWDSTQNTNDPRRNIVANNRAISCTSGGFHCDAPESVIQGNEAISCGYGFKVGTDTGSVQPTKRVSLVNNKAIGSVNDGFSLGAGDSLVVMGNQSYGSGGYGFATVSTAVNSVMIGNTAFGNTSGGIQGDAATKGFTLIGNSTQDTATNGAIVLQNGKMLYARKTDGTQWDAVKMNGSNELAIGHSSIPTRMSGSKTSFDTALVRKRATQTLAANGTVTIDVLAAQIHEVTLNANATSVAVSNSSSGMEFTLCFIQDATGGRTVTWPSGFKFNNNTAPTDTTANTRTIVTFLAGGSGTWREVSRAVAVP